MDESVLHQKCRVGRCRSFCFVQEPGCIIFVLGAFLPCVAFSHLVLVCLECLGLVCCEHGACLCKQGVLTWSFYHGFIFFSCSSYSTERIQELLQEGGEVKRRRERFQRQASMLSRLTRQLNFQEARASGFGDSGETLLGSKSFASLFFSGVKLLSLKRRC
jgi:hypothetical protein